MSQRKTLSHREYVLDRAKRVQQMFEEIADSDELRESFFKEPDAVARRFDVALRREESFAIKAMAEADLAGLRERLVMSPIAIFDANCGCAVADIAARGPIE